MQGQDIISRAEQAHSVWDDSAKRGGPGSVLVAGMTYGAEGIGSVCMYVRVFLQKSPYFSMCLHVRAFTCHSRRPCVCTQRVVRMCICSVISYLYCQTLLFFRLAPTGVMHAHEFSFNNFVSDVSQTFASGSDQLADRRAQPQQELLFAMD